MAKEEAAVPGTVHVGALPVLTLREAAPFLRRPFTPEATRFKVQSVFKDAKGCLVVAYIDARLVIERLNRVIPDKWEARNEHIPGSKLMVCRLTVGGVTREDVGESPKGLSKDLYSDALKRAAVHFGVGVSIYALPEIKLWLRDEKGWIEKRGTPKGDTLLLTELGHARLRESYARWLVEHGVARFGEPLDHGDTAGSLTDEAAEVGDQFAPEPPSVPDDDVTVRLVEECRVAYAAIHALGEGARRELPPARFKAWLTASSHSHEELGKLRAYLEEQLPGMTARHGS